MTTKNTGKSKQLINSKGAEIRLPSDYATFLEELKTRIHKAQTKAAIAVNRELVSLYWHIGQSIVERQKAAGWGTAVIEQLAHDIQKSFPGIAGFSISNIWRMRAFYLAYADQGDTKLAQLAREIGRERIFETVTSIPWWHNIVLIEKVEDVRHRLWYAQKTIEHGWSRAVLVHQIESNLHERQGLAINNFHLTLPSPQSDLAKQTLKDPYVFDFLNIAQDSAERQLERGLLEHIRNFLLELGIGFAFVGSQYHLEVDGEDFYLDLLFYHLRLRCYVVIDLKVENFKPEFAGKMNFYLAAVDNLLKHPGDQPSIGLILCKKRKKLIAEYALRNTKTPIGVSEYRLTTALPRELHECLPTAEELEAKLGEQ